MLINLSKIAEGIAAYAPEDKTVLVDAFAGVGGNTIAFALSGRWELVFGIEKDRTTLECAKHNAVIYGVNNKIWWIEGNAFSVLQNQLKTRAASAVVFASPPWGGPNYNETDIFDLAQMKPYNLNKIYRSFSRFSKDMALFLPRNSDLNQISQLADNDEEHFDAIHYTMWGSSKVSRFA